MPRAVQLSLVAAVASPDVALRADDELLDITQRTRALADVPAVLHSEVPLARPEARQAAQPLIAANHDIGADAPTAR